MSNPLYNPNLNFSYHHTRDFSSNITSNNNSEPIYNNNGIAVPSPTTFNSPTQYESIAYIKGGIPITRITAIPSPATQNRRSISNVYSSPIKKKCQEQLVGENHESPKSIMCTRIYYERNSADKVSQTEKINSSRELVPETTTAQEMKTKLSPPKLAKYTAEDSCSIETCLQQSQRIEQSFQHSAYENSDSPYHQINSQPNSRNISQQLQVAATADEKQMIQKLLLPTNRNLSLSKAAQIYSWISTANTAQSQVTNNTNNNNNCWKDILTSPVHVVPRHNNDSNFSNYPAGYLPQINKKTPLSLDSTEYLDPLIHRTTPTYRLDPNLSKEKEFWDESSPNPPAAAAEPSSKQVADLNAGNSPANTANFNNNDSTFENSRDVSTQNFFQRSPDGRNQDFNYMPAYTPNRQEENQQEQIYRYPKSSYFPLTPSPKAETKTVNESHETSSREPCQKIISWEEMLPDVLDCSEFESIPHESVKYQCPLFQISRFDGIDQIEEPEYFSASSYSQANIVYDPDESSNDEFNKIYRDSNESEILQPEESNVSIRRRILSELENRGISVSPKITHLVKSPFQSASSSRKRDHVKDDCIFQQPDISWTPPYGCTTDLDHIVKQHKESPFIGNKYSESEEHIRTETDASTGQPSSGRSGMTYTIKSENSETTPNQEILGMETLPKKKTRSRKSRSKSKPKTTKALKNNKIKSDEPTTTTNSVGGQVKKKTRKKRSLSKKPGAILNLPQESQLQNCNEHKNFDEQKNMMKTEIPIPCPNRNLEPQSPIMKVVPEKLNLVSSSAKSKTRDSPKRSVNISNINEGFAQPNSALPMEKVLLPELPSPKDYKSEIPRRLSAQKAGVKNTQSPFRNTKRHLEDVQKTIAAIKELNEIIARRKSNPSPAKPRTIIDACPENTDTAKTNNHRHRASYLISARSTKLPASVRLQSVIGNGSVSARLPTEKKREPFSKRLSTNINIPLNLQPMKPNPAKQKSEFN